MKNKFLILTLTVSLLGGAIFGETARERAERLLRQDANSISGNIAMGLALLDEDKVDEARPYLEKVTVLKRDIPFVWYLLAMIYEKKAERNPAISAWENVWSYTDDRKGEKAHQLKSIAEKHLKWLRENR
jgi:predicted Zn-dependent protease